jgi:hypothetical protein
LSSFYLFFFPSYFVLSCFFLPFVCSTFHFVSNLFSFFFLPSFLPSFFVLVLSTNLSFLFLNLLYTFLLSIVDTTR